MCYIIIIIIIRNKIRFMYDRMSQMAKEFVKNIQYKNFKLNNLFKEEIDKEN